MPPQSLSRRPWAYLGRRRVRRWLRVQTAPRLRARSWERRCVGSGELFRRCSFDAPERDGKVVAVRFWVTFMIEKVPSPAAVGVQGLQELTQRRIGGAVGQVGAILEQLQIDRQALCMEAMRDAGAALGIE